MAWYNYIPGSSFAKIPGDIKNGNWGDAGGHLLLGSSGLDPVVQGGKDANKYFFTDPANEAKASYDKATAQSQQGLQQLMGYIGGQQNQALGYYQPLQQMFNKTYGTQGIAAPQTPKAPGSAR